jgi:Spy/CpxP family protein refolding chaperone
MTDPTSSPEAARPSRLSRNPLHGLLLAAAFAATFAAGGLVLSGPSAWAMQDATDHMDAHGGMNAHAYAHLEHLLDAADATPEQRSKIEKIATHAMRKVAPLQPGLGSIHRDLRRLLSAPAIDQAALEQLRAGRVADVDQASRILIQALADAAEVLTPEQRAKVAAAMSRRPPAPQG